MILVHARNSLRCVSAKLLLATAAAILQTSSLNAALFEQILRSFGTNDGNNNAVFAGSVPERLIEGKDGLLYGMTPEGGITNAQDPQGAGTLYNINKNGTGYNILYWFDRTRLTNGVNPKGGLVEGSDGALYGTTFSGGGATLDPPYSGGTVFKINKDGTGHKVLYKFLGYRLGDGEGPLAGVIEGSDGLLYGTTSNGGTSGGGSIFRISKDGSNYSVIYDFGPFGSPTELLEGSDGVLYGIAGEGCTACGDYGASLFTVNKDGSGYNQLFCSQRPCGGDGVGSFVEGSDGLFYGSSAWNGDQFGSCSRSHQFHCDGRG